MLSHRDTMVIEASHVLSTWSLKSSGENRHKQQINTRATEVLRRKQTECYVENGLYEQMADMRNVS